MSNKLADFEKVKFVFDGLDKYIVMVRRRLTVGSEHENCSGGSEVHFCKYSENRLFWKETHVLFDITEVAEGGVAGVADPATITAPVAG